MTKAHRVISIGDGLWNLFTARNLGLEFLAIAEGEKAAAFNSRGVNSVTDFSGSLPLLQMAVR